MKTRTCIYPWLYPLQRIYLTERRAEWQSDERGILTIDQRRCNRQLFRDPYDLLLRDCLSVEAAGIPIELGVRRRMDMPFWRPTKEALPLPA